RKGGTAVEIEKQPAARAPDRYHSIPITQSELERRRHYPVTRPVNDALELSLRHNCTLLREWPGHLEVGRDHPPPGVADITPPARRRCAIGKDTGIGVEELHDNVGASNASGRCPAEHPGSAEPKKFAASHIHPQIIPAINKERVPGMAMSPGSTHPGAATQLF